MLLLVTVPLVILTILGYVGEALFPALVDDEHYVPLILLSPSMRNFGLATNSLDPFSYYGLGGVRVLLTDPLFYLLGYWYGSSAVTWLERRTRTWGSMLRQLEEGFGRWGYLILFALPYNFTTLFAGAARIPFRYVLPVRAAGLLLRMYLIRRAGEALEGPLDGLTSWIGDHRVPLLGVTISLVVISLVLELRRGDTDLETLAHFDEEMDELDEELDSETEREAEPKG